MSSAEIERALRQPPPERCLDWVQRQLLGEWTAIDIAPLYGGVWHATHRIELRGVASIGRTLVLRRWARPGWQISDPDFTARHEASSLRLIKEWEIPAPRLIGVDPDAEECDVPPVLQTLVPGSKPSPRREERAEFAGALATAILKVHRLEGPDAKVIALPYRRYYEVDRVRPPAWATRPSVWTEALGIATLPEPSGRRCFIHRDYHEDLAYWDIVDILDGTPDALFTGLDGSARIDRLEAHLEKAIMDFRRA